MAEHELHGPQVGPALQQVGGKGMTQDVRGDGRGDAGLQGVPVEELPESLAAQPSAGPVQKHVGIPHGLGQPGPHRGQVCLDLLQGHLPDRHEPLLFPLAVSHDVAHFQVEVLQPQCQQLGDPEARCVEEFQHGLVPDAEGLGRVGLGQEALHLVQGEVLGQGDPETRDLEQLGRVFLHVPLLLQEAEQAPEAARLAPHGAGRHAGLLLPEEIEAQVFVPHVAQGPAEGPGRPLDELDKVPAVRVEGVAGKAALHAQVVEVGVQEFVHLLIVRCRHGALPSFFIPSRGAGPEAPAACSAPPGASSPGR